jgi:hypothetical protein
VLLRYSSSSLSILQGSRLTFATLQSSRATPLLQECASLSRHTQLLLPALLAATVKSPSQPKICLTVILALSTTPLPIQYCSLFSVLTITLSQPVDADSLQQGVSTLVTVPPELPRSYNIRLFAIIKNGRYA